MEKVRCGFLFFFQKLPSVRNPLPCARQIGSYRALQTGDEAVDVVDGHHSRIFLINLIVKPNVPVALEISSIWNVENKLPILCIFLNKHTRPPQKNTLKKYLILRVPLTHAIYRPRNFCCMCCCCHLNIRHLESTHPPPRHPKCVEHPRKRTHRKCSLPTSLQSEKHARRKIKSDTVKFTLNLANRHHRMLYL